MDFDLTDDQRLLQDSIVKLMANRYGNFDLRQAYRKHPEGFDRAVWDEYAQSGLLALPFAEEYGGFGGGGVDTMLVMDQFGKSLAVEPYLASVVLAGAVLRHGAQPAMAAEFIPMIAGGEALFALACTERASRYDLHDVSTTARRDGADYLLEGEKSVVLAGDSADYIIVSARTAGGRRELAGISLFLIDAKAEGVSRRGYATQDGLRAAEISLASVRVPADRLIGTADAGLATLERAVDEGIAAICAEAVGAMEALNALTVDYMKTRKQFGVPISSFQALQFRSVDMLIAAEQAKSMAIFAALMAGEENPAERSRAMSSAKVQVARSARFVGQNATQLHGGIGMTMEYKGGHYFKRLTMLEGLFGDADHHLRRLAQAGSLLDAA
ncbi:MAG: pimeloyl-CoA dehydrogenase small subunit [Rhodospirillales bacterium 20-60-12]|nr:MAG: pimeloyl-CoA dehydrogenase small subunit [Rhodospirillales bacterium 20-60-12]HQT68108.1 acyl-CoA dehydrogenase family protein [Acetobacteraceae bacterium]